MSGRCCERFLGHGDFEWSFALVDGKTWEKMAISFNLPHLVTGNLLHTVHPGLTFSELIFHTQVKESERILSLLKLFEGFIQNIICTITKKVFL